MEQQQPEKEPEQQQQQPQPVQQPDQQQQPQQEQQPVQQSKQQQKPEKHKSKLAVFPKNSFINSTMNCTDSMESLSDSDIFSNFIEDSIINSNIQRDSSVHYLKISKPGSSNICQNYKYCKGEGNLNAKYTKHYKYLYFFLQI
jgi:hypothetical protein